MFYDKGREFYWIARLDNGDSYYSEKNIQVFTRQIPDRHSKMNINLSSFSLLSTLVCIKDYKDHDGIFHITWIKMDKN